MNILDQLAEHARQRVEAAKQTLPLAEIKRQALALPLAGAFWPRLAALGAGGCATAGVFLLAAWPLGLGEELARMRGTI